METIPREVQMKVCTTCKQLKPLEQFVPVSANEIKRASERGVAIATVRARCKSCYNEYHVRWRAGRREEYRKSAVEQYYKRLNRMTPEELAKFRADCVTKKKKRYFGLKKQIYDAYGAVCACCGETTDEFLTLDHVNNDGNHMRKNVHGNATVAFFKWIIANNYPDTIQVLCWNCQWGKVKNNGICPHRETRNDYPLTGSRAKRPEAGAAQTGR